MKTFQQWWKEYLPEHLACMNYEKDFKRVWDAAVEECDIQSEKDAEPF